MDRHLTRRLAGAALWAGLLALPSIASAECEWLTPHHATRPIAAGVENGHNLLVCRAAHQGGIHPGKVVAGKCNIGFAGHEIIKTRFEVVNNCPGTFSSSSSSPLVAGREANGSPLYVCRAAHANVWHPGKVVGGKCNISYGGAELTKASFQWFNRQHGHH